MFKEAERYKRLIFYRNKIHAPFKLLETLPNTKVIFIVRNPIGEQITIKKLYI